MSSRVAGRICGWNMVQRYPVHSSAYVLVCLLVSIWLKAFYRDKGFISGQGLLFHQADQVAIGITHKADP